MKKLLCILTAMALAMSLFAGAAGAAGSIRVYDAAGAYVATLNDFNEVAPAYMQQGYTLRVYEGEYTHELVVMADNFSVIGVGNAANIKLPAVIHAPNVRHFTMKNVTVTMQLTFGVNGRDHEVTGCGLFRLAFNDGCRDIIIRQNKFCDETRSGQISFDDEIGSGIKITYNEMANGLLIRPMGDADVDMTHNYWGGSAGPALQGTGTPLPPLQSYTANGYQLNFHTNPFNDHILLQPWLDKAPDKNPKPVFAIKNVARDKYYWSLSEALAGGDAVAAGDVLNIGPFTFEDAPMPPVTTSVTIAGTDKERSAIAETVIIQAHPAPTAAINVTLKNLVLKRGAAVTGNDELAVTAAFDQVMAEAPAAAVTTITVTAGTTEDARDVAVTVANSTVKTGIVSAIKASQPKARLAVTGSTLVQAGGAPVAVDLYSQARLTEFSGNTLKGEKDPARLAGADRFETAIKISEKFHSAGEVVLARADNFADALAGAVYAGVGGCPILLTGTNNLPAAVLRQLGPLGLNANKVTILGGAGAVSEKVAGDLRAAGFSVERIAGADRFETAVKIAEATSFTAAPKKAVICRGDEFADALAAVPFAANIQHGPILLVRQNSIPPAVLEYINEMQIEEFTIIGGAGAVSNAVADALHGLEDTAGVNRIYGANRYETAAEVAKAIAGSTGTTVYLARGDNFADALAGGPLAIKDSGVIMLTASGSLSGATAEVLNAAVWCDQDVFILGGAGAVSPAVADAVIARNFAPVRRNTP